MEINKDEITGVDNPAQSQPLFEVSQNYPNPARGITKVGLAMREPANVSTEVVDVTGRKVLEIPEQYFTTGQHIINLDCTNFSKGIYFYTLKANKTEITRKMIVE